MVTGIMGSSEVDELEQRRGGLATDYDGELPNRLNETSSNAKTLFLASDVLTGAALIVGGSLKGAAARALERSGR